MKTNSKPVKTINKGIGHIMTRNIIPNIVLRWIPEEKKGGKA